MFRILESLGIVMSAPKVMEAAVYQKAGNLKYCSTQKITLSLFVGHFVELIFKLYWLRSKCRDLLKD